MKKRFLSATSIIVYVQLILIDTYLPFVFQWHLLQPERRVVCVGELKIVVHPTITPRFCHSLRSLWNVSVICALGGTLKISITKSMAITIVAITWFASGWFRYTRISKTLRFSKRNYETIKLLNVNV